MRITSTIYAAAMAVGMTLAAGSAFAQSQTCACVVSATSRIIGKVESVSGKNVRVTQEAGFASAQSNAQLQSGWTVMVGANSSTRLLLGAQECVVDLGANQSMTLISQGNGNICAAVRNEAPAGAGNTTAAAVGTLAGTAALVTGVIVFSQENETVSVSRQ